MVQCKIQIPNSYKELFQYRTSEDGACFNPESKRGKKSQMCLGLYGEEKNNKMAATALECQIQNGD